MRHLFAIATLLGAIAIYGVAAASQQQDGCRGADTPRETLQQFIHAAGQDDWPTAFDYVNARSRPRLFRPFLVKLILGLHVKWAWDSDDAKVAANAKILYELAKVLRDNGFEVDQNNTYPDLEKDIEGISSWPKLMSGIARFSKAHLKRDMFSASTEIGPVNVSGNEAHAQLTQARGGTDSVKLSKANDVWCISGGFEGEQ